MRRILLLVLCVVLLGSAVPASAVITLYYPWTGIGNGWKGQIAPTGSGGENLEFGDNVSTYIKIPSPVFSINSAAFTSDNRFFFVPQSGSTTLSIGVGGIAVNTGWNNSTDIDFDSGITVNLSGSQTWDLGSGGGSVTSSPATLLVSVPARVFSRCLILYGL